MKLRIAGYLVVSLVCGRAAAGLLPSDWPQFRGKNGAAIAENAKPPVRWSDTENLRWRVALPGPGTSSPIVAGQFVFVTCWSGYGEKSRAGSNRTLERQLLCFDRSTGKIAWSKSVPGETNPDDYQDFLQEHGYASHTPVTDGECIYVYFGRGGALCFDLHGRQLWQAKLGNGANAKNWGSASSPVLYKDSVIINASEESHAIYALDKRTGKQLWKSEAASLEYVFGTPLVVEDNDSPEIIIVVPGEIWSLNPASGKTRWYAQTGLEGNVAPSAIATADTVFAFGGFPRTGAVAIRRGGRGDVTKTHLAWNNRNSTYVPTPVAVDGKIYFVNDAGFATCLDEKTGDLIFKERLPGASAGGSRGKPFYASAVFANGLIYATSRWNGTYVFAAKPQFNLEAQSKFEADPSQFNATPAISGNEIFLRSDRYLYCMSSRS